MYAILLLKTVFAVLWRYKFMMRLHSGDICPKTGTYRVINEDGKTLNSVFVGEGETMPPTQCSSCCYEFAE